MTPPPSPSLKNMALLRLLQIASMCGLIVSLAYIVVRLVFVIGYCDNPCIPGSSVLVRSFTVEDMFWGYFSDHGKGQFIITNHDGPLPDTGPWDVVARTGLLDNPDAIYKESEAPDTEPAPLAVDIRVPDMNVQRRIDVEGYIVISGKTPQQVGPTEFEYIQTDVHSETVSFAICPKSYKLLVSSAGCDVASIFAVVVCLLTVVFVTVYLKDAREQCPEE